MSRLFSKNEKGCIMKIEINPECMIYRDLPQLSEIDSKREAILTQVQSENLKGEDRNNRILELAQEMAKGGGIEVVRALVLAVMKADMQNSREATNAAKANVKRTSGSARAFREEVDRAATSGFDAVFG